MLGKYSTVQRQRDELTSLINKFGFMQKSMTASLIFQLISSKNYKEDVKIHGSDLSLFHIVKKKKDSLK